MTRGPTPSTTPSREPGAAPGSAASGLRPDPDSSFSVLLLSGGIDSAAVAAIIRPAQTIFIDYRQRPRVAEARAAAAVASELDLTHREISVDLSMLGAGLLSDEHVPDGWPSPEWWPFRNQLLVTLAAAWTVKNRPDVTGRDRAVRVLTGTVASDGNRHADGTTGFYDRLDSLVRYQEGGISVLAPAIGLTTVELVTASCVSDSVLGWTHSCHRGDLPCLDCPGCHKRAQVLERLGRLQ